MPVDHPTEATLRQKARSLVMRIRRDEASDVRPFLSRQEEAADCIEDLVLALDALAARADMLDDNLGRVQAHLQHAVARDDEAERALRQIADPSYVGSYPPLEVIAIYRKWALAALRSRTDEEQAGRSAQRLWRVVGRVLAAKNPRPRIFSTHATEARARIAQRALAADRLYEGWDFAVEKRAAWASPAPEETTE